jgi:hypothetical protein
MWRLFMSIMGLSSKVDERSGPEKNRLWTLGGPSPRHEAPYGAAADARTGAAAAHARKHISGIRNRVYQLTPDPALANREIHSRIKDKTSE